MKIRFIAGASAAMCSVSVLMLTLSLNAREDNISSRLHVTIIDVETGKKTPARVEVVNEQGMSFIAEDALQISVMSIHPCVNMIVVNEPLEVARSRFRTAIQSPYTGKEHFYSTGESHLKLPPGAYKVRAFKGPEYYLGTIDVELEAGEESERKIVLTRFDNMPAKGWYSSDGHMHLDRTNRGVDPQILKQMQAEDIHVGNVLHVGTADSLSMAPQYAFGTESIFQEGDYLIATGQENLRNHILGHTITLGANEPLRDNKTYLIYRKQWEKALEQGGINGYAHWGEHIFFNYVPISGVPLVAPHNLMHFIEVLQFNRARYDTWYDMLNLGFRIAPTAGTDGGIPGVDRFYARVDGSLTYGKWLDAVRKGRTFVTTGPLLEFNINGQEIGAEIVLPAAGKVTVEGAIHYDPERDVSDLKFSKSSTAFDLFDNPENGYVLGLELIENGSVIRRFARVDNSGIIKFKIELTVERSAWLALRTINITSDETSGRGIFPHLKKAAIAHTAPIYVAVKNSDPISRQFQARAVARSYLASLDLLEERFTGDNVRQLSKLNDPYDGISEETLLKNQAAVIEEIKAAKVFFRGYLK